MHWPVTTLGYGRRIGIWFQGCSIGCKGCCSRDTWPTVGGHKQEVSEVLAWIERLTLDTVDGFTISGGEPFDQPRALLELLKSIRSIPNRRDRQPRDLLIYSGFSWERLRREHEEITMLADALITEPFVEGRPAKELFGSDNQRLRSITGLGRARYGDGGNASTGRLGMQFHHDGNQMWLIGIPKRGDLELLRGTMEAKGVSLAACTWLA